MNINKKSSVTVGLLSFSFNEYNSKIREAIIKTAQLNKANLICFFGWSIDLSYNLLHQKNVLYDLINKEIIDGLIIPTSALTTNVDNKKLSEFIKRFYPIPVVSLGEYVKEIPNVLIDNKTGMHDLMIHLIKDHKYRRIAFVKGPSTNNEANLRFQVYKEALKDSNLTFNEKRVAQGNFDVNSYAGGKAVSTFLDKRKVSFDAIVCSTDVMARDAVLELKKRGIKVPGDVAVTGFDNLKESKFISPPLTTVYQTVDKLGEEGFYTLLKLINKENVPDKKILPTQLIVRRSCGCLNYPGLKTIDSIKIINKSGNITKSKQTLKEEIINQIKNDSKLKYRLLNKDFNLLQNIPLLLDAFFISVENGNDKFLLVLENMVIESSENDIEASTWSIILFRIFQIIKYSKYENNIYADDLFENALIIISNIAKRFKLFSDKYNESQSFSIYEMNSYFTSCLEMDSFKKIVLKYFPKIGINSCYICSYANQKRKKARLLVGYDKKRNTLFKEENALFPVKQLVPDWVNLDSANYSYYLMALYYEDKNLGYVLFDSNMTDEKIYERLVNQLSSTLKEIELMNKIKAYSRELEQKVKERTMELEDANLKLQNLDSLKNDFIANITHDFRSPLTVILNMSDLAIKSKSLSFDSKETFDIIYKSSLRLNNSINRLLELAKMDAHGLKLKVRKVELVSVMEGIFDFYTSSVMGSGIKIEKDFSVNEIQDFYTDVDKLEEIIDNIISNAIKFVDPHNGKITLELKEKSGVVQIIITDNGKGISRDKLNSIFNRFEQAHAGRNSQYRGTGIGLAFAKQLVEYLNGRIWAESEGEDKGAKFIIELKNDKNFFDKWDIAANDIKHKKHVDLKKFIESEIENKLDSKEIQIIFKELNKENEFNYRKGIILIMDDDRNIRKIILGYLKNYGYQNFIIASDGKKGLDAVYEYSPDIIICDFNMPGLKGDEVHDELISNPVYNEIPFIFLSAVADENLIVERRKKGANAYLKKPIDEKIFLITVEEHLKRYYERLKIIRLASIDELTGLNNRRSIVSSIKHELSVRKYRDVSLIFFDVDNFKGVNDTFGHQVGDRILSEIGNILRNKLRNYDMAGRYGGDEFIVILPDTNLNDAYYVAEGLRKAICNLNIEYNSKKISASSSFGIASLIDHAAYIEKELGISNLHSIYEIKDAQAVDWENIEKVKVQISELLLKMADMALYNAKYTICNKCGFKSEKSGLFENNTCPECKSNKLILGRDKVIKFE